MVISKARSHPLTLWFNEPPRDQAYLVGQLCQHYNLSSLSDQKDKGSCKQFLKTSFLQEFFSVCFSTSYILSETHGVSKEQSDMLPFLFFPV